MTGRLQFKGEYSTSAFSKCLMTGAILATVLYSGRLLLSNPETGANGNSIRNSIMLTCLVIYLLRLSVTLYVFLKRRIAWWETVLGALLFPFLLYSYAYATMQYSNPINVLDVTGILLYLAGSYLGTGSEYARYRWKLKPENKGHLYTEGLFKRVRHINYFGDIVLFSGFGLITQELWMLIIPAIMTLSFIVLVIPAHDTYLQDRYGDEYGDYAQRSKKLIPFIY